MDLQQQAGIRQALLDIIHELRQPMPVYFHQIKQLKGKGYYIFLPWEAYRDRLTSVVPDYSMRFYDFQANIELNLAIVHCEITILGVSKSEIGGVPISELSSSGNESTRGNSLDRAHAEAFKNACEAWGVGQYISDQYFTWKLLNSQKHLIPEATRDQLNRVQLFLQSQEKSGELKSIAKIKSLNGEDIGLPVLAEEDVATKASKPQPRVIQQVKPKVAPEVAVATGLYPQHRTIMKGFVGEFWFDGAIEFVREAIAKSYPGKTVVADCGADEVIDLMTQVAAAWAHSKGCYESPANALNVIKSKVEFFKAASGGTVHPEAIAQVCLEWRQSLLLPSS